MNKTLKKIVAYSTTGLLFLSQLLPIVEAKHPLSSAVVTYERRSHNHWLPDYVVDPINNDFDDIMKCLTDPSLNGKPKEKSFNVATNAWGIGISAHTSLDELERKLRNGEINTNEYDKYSACLFWGSQSWRFIKAIYKQNIPSWAVTPWGKPIPDTSKDRVKDYFIEGGFYRLNYAWEKYSFINSFYLFNWEKWLNDIDFWFKSFLSIDNSMLQANGSDNSYHEKVDKHSSWLRHWLEKTNQLDTKFLWYNFFAKESIDKTKISSKDLNKALVKYFSVPANKTKFIHDMNQKKLWEYLEMTIEGIDVYAMWLQLNPYARLLKKEWSLSYQKSKNSSTWGSTAYNDYFVPAYNQGKIPHPYSMSSAWDRWASYTNDFNISFLPGSYYLLAQTLDTGRILYPKNEYYSIQYWSNAWPSYPNYNTAKPNVVRNAFAADKIANLTFGYSIGLINAYYRYYWWYSTTEVKAAEKFSWETAFSYYDTYNYLTNRQSGWEQYKLNNEDWYIKNGTSRTRMKLDQWVYVTSIVWLPNIIEGFDKVSQDDYNVNFSINYWFDFTKKDQNNNSGSIVVADAFRWAFNPRMAKTFKQSEFKSFWTVWGTPPPPTPWAYDNVNAFIDAYKKIWTIFTNDDEDTNDTEEIVDIENTYNNEKGRKALEVIRENNLFWHYRNIKDWDSIVPKNMQIFGNIPTEYTTSILAPSNIAVENLWDDANAYLNTKKDYTYNAILGNKNWCDVYKEQGCLSSYWEILDSDPTNLVKYNWAVPWNFSTFKVDVVWRVEHPTRKWEVRTVNVVGNFILEPYKFQVNGENGLNYKSNELISADVNRFIRNDSSISSNTFGTKNIHFWLYHFPIFWLTWKGSSSTNTFNDVTEFEDYLKKPEVREKFAQWFSNYTTSPNGYVGNSRTWDAEIIDGIYVSMGSKIGKSQLTTISDEKQKLMWVIGDYDITKVKKTKKITDKNGNVLWTISERYMNDFDSVKSNLVITKNWEKHHTLPFGWYLLDTEPKMTKYVFDGTNVKNYSARPHLILNRDNLIAYSYMGNNYGYNNPMFRIEDSTSGFGFKHNRLWSTAWIDKDNVTSDQTKTRPVGKSQGLYTNLTVASKLPNSKNIENNNSYWVYYLKNSYNKSKYLFVTTKIWNEQGENTDTQASRGYTFGLNAPIMPINLTEDEKWQLLIPYASLVDRDYNWQFWNSRVTLTTTKFEPENNANLDAASKAYKLPFWLISFNKNWVLGQRRQQWQPATFTWVDKDWNPVTQPNDWQFMLPYDNISAYSKDGSGKYEVDDDEYLKKTVWEKRLFILKWDSAKHFFNGTSDGSNPFNLGSSALQYYTTNAWNGSPSTMTQKQYNIESFVNALLLNLMVNHGNVDFKNIKKNTDDLVEPKVYYLLDPTNNNYYFLIKIQEKNVTPWTTGIWMLPILVNGNTWKIRIFNKVQYKSTLRKYHDSVDSSSKSNNFHNQYFFQYIGDAWIWWVKVEQNDVYEVLNNTTTLNAFKTIFSGSVMSFTTDVGVSIIHTPKPYVMGWTSVPNSINSFFTNDWVDNNVNYNQSMFGGWTTNIENWSKWVARTKVINPWTPSETTIPFWVQPYEQWLETYVSWEAYSWSTQYIAGLNDTIVNPDKIELINKYNNKEITKAEYEAAQGTSEDDQIKSWEEENVNNSNKNIWLYKMNFQQKKFITVVNMKEYSAFPPHKNIYSTISGEWGTLFSSTDTSFKYNPDLLQAMRTYIDNSNILNKEYYDVNYKLDWKPVTFNASNAGQTVKTKIQILTNFSEAKWITVDYSWSSEILDRLASAELHCWNKNINILSNLRSSTWIARVNDTFKMYNGKKPIPCYVSFDIPLPSTEEEASQISNQSFKFKINLDTQVNQNWISEKEHEFETKWFNIKNTTLINSIDSVPNCKIVAKTKATVGNADSNSWTSINEETGIVELDVWYRDPELKSADNYEIKKPLYWTQIKLELNWNAQFVNNNNEYYSNLMNKNALNYASNSVTENKYVKTLIGLMKRGFEYSPNKVSLFLASHYKRNRFYGKTTFLVVPKNWDINNFSFNVKWSCTFKYMWDNWNTEDKVLNSDTSVSFRFPQVKWIKDTATMSYYNPANKEWGTLYSSWFSKQDVALNGKQTKLLIKQYYPTILSLSYNHVSPAQVGNDGIDTVTKIVDNNNGIDNSEMYPWTIHQLEKGCLTSNTLYHSPQDWVNGDAEQCLNSWWNYQSALWYEKAHPYKWWSWYGVWAVNIRYSWGGSSESWTCYAPQPHIPQYMRWYNEPGKYEFFTSTNTCNHSNSWYTKQYCYFWTNNSTQSLSCWENTEYTYPLSVSTQWVWGWEKNGQWFGWYYWLWVDWSFEIDKKQVGNDSWNKVFFDRILPVCMDKATDDWRYKTLTLSEKSWVVMIDNWWDLNQKFIDSVDWKTCVIPSKAIKILPMWKKGENTYLKNGKDTITANNVIDKLTWLPFFLKSNSPNKAPNIQSVWWDTSVHSVVDKDWIINLFLNEEIIKEIKNNPDNIKIEFRVIDSDKLSTLHISPDTIPWGSAFLKLGWNSPMTHTNIDKKKWGKVTVQFRIWFKLNLKWVTWPSKIKNNKLYKLLDEWIKTNGEEKMVDLQMPILALSSFNESFANSVNELNQSFLAKWSQNVVENLKTVQTSNFNIQMKYKKFAASSYRTGYNEHMVWMGRHRACWRYSCRSRTSRGSSMNRARMYGSSASSANYIRWFNRNTKNMNATPFTDSIITTFYPYTDNTWEQINNKTVMINWIPSIKNIGDNQLVYQGICNVCNQYRGNIFEQHPIGFFNPEHKEKGATTNIFDYYNDWRNFTIKQQKNFTIKPKQKVLKITWEIVTESEKTRKAPFVNKLYIPEQVEVVEVFGGWTEDTTKNAVKYYWKKAVLIGKQTEEGDKNPPSTLISADIIPADFDNINNGKKIENDLVVLSEWDIIIGSDVNFINAVLVTKWNLIIMPWNTSLKIHWGLIVNGKILNYRTNVTDINPDSYSWNYKTYLKNLDLFDLKYPVLLTIDPRYTNSEIFNFISSVSKSAIK